MSLRTMWYATGIVFLGFAVYLQSPIGVVLCGGSLLLLAAHDASKRL